MPSSSHKRRAEWFALRFSDENDKPVVYTYTFKKDDIFAYFSDRGESEIVVDAKKIVKTLLKEELL